MKNGYDSPFAVNFRKHIDRTQAACKAEKPKRNIRKELARHCGVSEQTISNWYNGNNEPKPELRGKVASFFRVSESDFYGTETDLFDSDFINDVALWEKLESICKEEDIEYIENFRKQYPCFFSHLIQVLHATSKLDLHHRLGGQVEIGNLIIPKRNLAKMLIGSFCRKLEQAMCYAIGRC